MSANDTPTDVGQRFTDEEKNQFDNWLKLTEASYEEKHLYVPSLEVTYFTLKGLLKRLEAAENAIAHSHGLASSWCCEKAKELDKEWRRAAGQAK